MNGLTAVCVLICYFFMWSAIAFNDDDDKLPGVISALIAAVTLAFVLAAVYLVTRCVHVAWYGN